METLEKDGIQFLRAKIVFGQRILSTILTVYAPTLLLNIIGHSTNYFKPFYFEAIVSVNLTVMLTLTTIFITVITNLPKTSYIKMIDIWLIANLILPFVEVLLHTYEESLRNVEEINDHGYTKKVDDEIAGDNYLRKSKTFEVVPVGVIKEAQLHQGITYNHSFRPSFPAST